MFCDLSLSEITFDFKQKLLSYRLALFKTNVVLCLLRVSELSVLHYIIVFVRLFTEAKWNALLYINV